MTKTLLNDRKRFTRTRSFHCRQAVEWWMSNQFNSTECIQTLLDVFRLASLCGLVKDMARMGDEILNRSDSGLCAFATLIVDSLPHAELVAGKVAEWISIALYRFKKTDIWFRVAQYAAVAQKSELFKEAIQWADAPISVLDSRSLVHSVAASNNAELLNEIRTSDLLPLATGVGMKAVESADESLSMWDLIANGADLNRIQQSGGSVQVKNGRGVSCLCELIRKGFRNGCLSKYAELIRYLVERSVDFALEGDEDSVYTPLGLLLSYAEPRKQVLDNAVTTRRVLPGGADPDEMKYCEIFKLFFDCPVDSHT